jgi:hypothetical protein
LDNVWLFFSCLKSKHFFRFNYVPHLFLLTCVKFHGKKINNNDTLTHIWLLPKNILKFFRQNNYTEKAKILYFLNLVYFLSLVSLWQNHVLYWPLTGFMWHNRTPFGKRVVNKYGSVCHYYWSFFHGTLHMWARIDEEHN